MKTKRCTRCRVVKAYKDFYNDKSHKTGKLSACKHCQDNKLHFQWDTVICSICDEAKPHEEYYRTRYHSSKSTHKNATCKDCSKAKEKLRRKIDATKIRESLSKKNKQRRKEDPIYKLKANIRYSIYRYIKDKGGKSSIEILGCDILKLKEHLTEQFSKGMTWDNYGEWHIDHIIPLSSTNTKEEVLKLNHYTNLQPLWAKDNLKKGSKLDWEQR